MKKKHKNKKSVSEDALKAFKKQSRDEELQAFGHPISYARIFRNRKKYTRKTKHRLESVE